MLDLPLNVSDCSVFSDELKIARRMMCHAIYILMPVVFAYEDMQYSVPIPDIS